MGSSTTVVVLGVVQRIPREIYPHRATSRREIRAVHGTSRRRSEVGRTGNPQGLVDVDSASALAKTVARSRSRLQTVTRMVSGALSGGCGRAFVRGERFGRLKDATRVRFNSHIGEGALCFWYREQQTGWGKRDRAVIVNSGESGDQLVCDRSVASAHEGSLGIASVLEPARRSKK